MLEHCDFVAQASTRDTEGDLLRPDLVVRIPGGKHVVVDCEGAARRVPRGVRDDGRGGAIAPGSPRTRVRCATTSTKLAAKSYWRQFSPAPDFVVMFVPDETLLRVAHEHDRRLGEDAWAQGVVLASPSTLMTLLRTVAAVWQQETVARERAGRATSSAPSCTSGSGRSPATSPSSARSLDGAVGSYNEAVGSFESRVLVQARRLEEHGVAGDARVAWRRSSVRHGRSALASDEAAVVELPRDAHAA